MKSKLMGWIVGAIFVLAVIAIASRVGVVKNLVFGNGAAKAA